MDDPCLIALDSVRIRYATGAALDGVSLRVRRGECVGVIGPNGAGKSTLLRVVSGLVAPASGHAHVLGEDPHRSGHRLRRRIGCVAQMERPDPRLPIRVVETVRCGCYGRLGLFRRPGAEEERLVDDALAWAGISHLAQRPLAHLSGGEYQRAAIARVLAQDPELFLFDEPTASIDPHAQRALIALIERLHTERGATVLYVTHDLAALPGVCERLVLMKSGRIWREGAREAMLDPALLGALYAAEEAGDV